MRQAKLIREEQGKTLFDVSVATGIRPSRLSRFERGARLMRYPALKRLAEFYGCTIDELIAEAEEEVATS